MNRTVHDWRPMLLTPEDPKRPADHASAALLRAGGNPGKLYDEFLRAYELVQDARDALCMQQRDIAHRIAEARSRAPIT